MRGTILGILAAALLAPAAFAQNVVVDDVPAQGGTVVTSAVSRAFFLDTREGTRDSDGSETLTYSTRWVPVGDSSVTILQSDGVAPTAVTVAEGLGDEGTQAWTVTRDGTYTLTHSTMQGGVSVSNETAVFRVRGVTPALAPALKWKYAKNANGWYCAQVAFAWHAGYDELVTDMRLLFADRTNAEGKLSAYLVKPATVLDPVDETEEYEGTVYRVARIDLSGFASLADGARAVYGVSDATIGSGVDSVPAAERKICLRVANRDLASVEHVANMLACLAWKYDNEDVFLPISEATVPARRSALQSASRPLSVSEANLSAAFGLSAAAVTRGAVVTCRVSTMSIGEDGSVAGTFEIAAEDAAGVVAESGELAPGVAFSVLGATSVVGSYEPLGEACGVSLLSRTPPYAFRVADPGDASFFKVRLEAENVFE